MCQADKTADPAASASAWQRALPHGPAAPGCSGAALGWAPALGCLGERAVCLLHKGDYKASPLPPCMCLDCQSYLLQLGRGCIWHINMFISHKCC